MSEILEEQLASYKDAFSMFDLDNDGRITIVELGIVMRSLGRVVTDQQLKEILDEIDVDHNGTIEFNEFLDLMKRNPLKPGQSTIEEQDELFLTFSEFDKDKSGNISISELGQVMHSLGERLTPDQLQSMIDEADLDGDHEISFQEFKKMITEMTSPR